MLQEHEPQVSVSTAFFKFSSFHECFYNLIETRRTCFLFLLDMYGRRFFYTDRLSLVNKIFMANKSIGLY